MNFTKPFCDFLHGCKIKPGWRHGNKASYLGVIAGTPTDSAALYTFDSSLPHTCHMWLGDSYTYGMALEFQLAFPLDTVHADYNWLSSDLHMTTCNKFLHFTGGNYLRSVYNCSLIFQAKRWLLTSYTQLPLFIHQQPMTYYTSSKRRGSRVSNQYSDDRYNRTRLRRTYILPEVGGDFRR